MERIVDLGGLWESVTVCGGTDADLMLTLLTAYQLSGELLSVMSPGY